MAKKQGEGEVTNLKLVRPLTAFLSLAPTMENQMENQMENEMETGGI